MSKSDTSLYMWNELDSLIVIMLYLDDLVIGEKGLAKLTKVKSLLSGRFEMKDLHKLHYFLGIEVIRTPVGIMISQRNYILNLLYKCGMTAGSRTMEHRCWIHKLEACHH